MTLDSRDLRHSSKRENGNLALEEQEEEKDR